ncbi:MAG: hypothetical protein AVDCRST_MAG77-4616 [uncultured Chloroflexi bacterium]|uniref:Uncharacterized protein n=1 Tax=uncultured Chloroflexota bacterium TaxID=166587 RepID=A0A6J4JXQ1_9CHLR|nr:MAG: hypothetical protein AVDCRST_MAG77-4616 [uncultured Chloroflexota bacterium]
MGRSRAATPAWAARRGAAHPPLGALEVEKPGGERHGLDALQR